MPWRPFAVGVNANIGLLMSHDIVNVDTFDLMMVHVKCKILLFWTNCLKFFCHQIVKNISTFSANF